MRKTIIGIILLFVGVSSCSRKISEPSDELALEYMDMIISQKIQSYQHLMPHKYQTDPAYMNSVKIINKLDSVVHKIQTDNFQHEDKPSLINFIEMIKPRLFKVDYPEKIQEIPTGKINESERREALLKIKLIELMLIEDQYERHRGYYYPIMCVKACYNAKSNVVKLGESYEAEITLAGENPAEPFVYLVDGDTIHSSGPTGTAPIFRTTPTSKGVKKHKVEIILHSGTVCEANIEYVVE